MFQSPMDNCGLASSGPSTSAPYLNMGPSGISPSNPAAPALPPRPNMSNNGFGYRNGGYGYDNGGFGSYGGYGSSFGGLGNAFGGYGGFGNNYGSFGNSYGGYGNSYGGYGAPYGGGFNRFGMNPYGDVESRFIQMAEESSRPAFQSIESLVNAIGSVAMMLDNTFVALTSSFRAVLGVAENFGRLRSLFAQFWSTLAIIRSINWLIRKLMVILGIRTENEFKAWAEAALQTQNGSGDFQNGKQPGTKSATWPILLFFGIVFAAPYVILKLLSGLNTSIQEKLTDPSTWRDPLKALAQFDFQATNPQEISFRANQVITIAPQAIQGSMWSSGWLMATTDGKHAGLIPINYVKFYRPAAIKNAGDVTTNNAVTTESKQNNGQVAPAHFIQAEEPRVFNENLARSHNFDTAGQKCQDGDFKKSNLSNVQNELLSTNDLEKAYEESSK